MEREEEGSKRKEEKEENVPCAENEERGEVSESVRADESGRRGEKTRMSTPPRVGRKEKGARNFASPKEEGIEERECPLH